MTEKPDSGNNDDWKRPVQKRGAEDGRFSESKRGSGGDRRVPPPPDQKKKRGR